MTLNPGDLLNNRYRIVKLLGKGGFGAVYRAWDLNLDSPRALKENLDTSPNAQRQFKREAQILDKLTHPNLTKVIDHFVIPEQGQYLVMEFVEGRDLQEMLDEQGGPLPEPQVLQWIAQICDALSYLHSQNPPVIHRDIKPANIKISPQGKAMLVDFGIAKVFDANMQTTIGARALTPGYAPLEQYGQGKTDARTDLYALGATLYTVLTGERPLESVQRTIKDDLKPPEMLNPKLSTTPISGIIHRALEMDPDRRFQSADQFKTSLINTLRNPQGGVYVSPARPGVVVPAMVQTIAAGTSATQGTGELTRPPTKLAKWGLLGGVLGFVLIGAVVVVVAAIFLLNKAGRSDETSTLTALASTGTGEIQPTSKPGGAIGTSEGSGGLLAATEAPAKTETTDSGSTNPMISTSTVFMEVDKPADIPVMPGAKELQVFRMTQGQNNTVTVSFSVDVSEEDIIAYYATEMPANGWEQTGTYADANQKVVYYKKGNTMTMLIISNYSGKIMVNLTVMEQ